MIIKNSNIRRSIFENRYVIFVIIFAIILAFLMIRILNASAKEKMKAKNNEMQNTQVQQPKKDTSSQAVITQTEVTKPVQQNNIKIIESFIEYCNQKEIEKAYALLTDECKESIFFSNIQYFKKNYIEEIFKTKKMYEVQAWVNQYASQTYRVKFMEDILSTGKITTSQDTKEDYITIVNNGNETKLNINGYVGRQQLSRQTNINGVQVTLVYRDHYMEYETYSIQIENQTQHTILIDTQEKVNSIYLESSDENTYPAFSYQMDRTELIVKPNESKTITIPFHKIYSNRAIIRKVIFQDVITNYEEYSQVENKKQYNNRTAITIEI